MIAIKDMEMPKSCSECGIKSGSYCYYKKPPYNFNGFNFFKGRHDDCLLVEIITCKECKHWQKIKDYHGRCKLFDKVWKGNSFAPIEHGTNEEFYCQMAERRGDKE